MKCYDFSPTQASASCAINGILHNKGGMLENMGAVVAINDMLMQSHGGALQFFPVWDAASLGPASFQTLRGAALSLVPMPSMYQLAKPLLIHFYFLWDTACSLLGYGAFLVSAAIDKSGTVSPITIVSEKGQDCAVVSPWGTLKVMQDNGHPVKVVQRGTIFTFSTLAGAGYKLSEQ
jgi:hypothetical protein